MIRLDHFVVHVDEDMHQLLKLKQRIEPLGFPFEPEWGKGTKGFKTANIWIGDQYFEIVWLKTPDGGGWKKEWVKQYHQGSRGIIALFLLTDELNNIRNGLAERGIAVSEPERIRFRWFFGLLKKTLPWKMVYTDPIPGTNLQISFIEMDSPRAMKQMRKYMVPNSREKGIDGIHKATVKFPFTQEAIHYLQCLFPEITLRNGTYVFDMGETKLCFQNETKARWHVELEAHSCSKINDRTYFEIENVKVYVSSA